MTDVTWPDLCLKTFFTTQNSKWKIKMILKMATLFELQKNFFDNTEMSVQIPLGHCDNIPW